MLQKVTTKNNRGYYWTPKMALNMQKLSGKLLFCPKVQKKPWTNAKTKKPRPNAEAFRRSYK